ncbi:hypothetical protein D0T60_18875, partial [Bacteroides sp. 224]|nr:hypothetical protein [Bacteroides sp. 224]
MPIRDEDGKEIRKAFIPDEDYKLLDEFFRAHPTVCNGITFNSKVYT